jgi:hypothetical protein
LPPSAEPLTTRETEMLTKNLIAIVASTAALAAPVIAHAEEA